MIKKVLIPVLFSVFLVGTYEYLIYNPRHLWVLFFGSMILIALESLFILKVLEKGEWKTLPLYMILPLLLNGGGMLGFSFLSREFFQQMFVALYFVLFVLLFYSLQERHQWHKEVYLFLTITSVFTYLFAMYSFSALTGMKGQYYLVVLGLFAGLLFQLFAYYELLNWKNIFLIMCSLIVLLELFWALNFLPSSTLTLAVVLSTVFYMIAGVALNAARKILTLRSILEYFVISAIIIIVVFATSLWVPIL